ncbi:hypothetical protein ACF1AY_04860 [Streptomyces sp. NPDC014776]|uniref:hypothetical protein n=1 Tax=Streptomyces sp. NPDC014776 TaxID=3364909 RepID=UPI0037026DE9
MRPSPTAGLAQCPECDEPLIIPVTYRHATPTVVALSFDLSQAREHLATHEARITTELPPTAR